MSDLSALLPALDTFLEAARRIERDRTLRPVLAKCEKALQKAFRRQGRALVKRLEGIADKWPVQEADIPAGWEWESLFDEAAEETLDDFVTAIEAAVKAALRAGGAQGIADAAVGTALAFGLDNPRAVQYIAEHGADLVRNINETTRGYLRTVIRQGVAEGWSPKRVAQAIIERYEEFAVGRPQHHVESRAHMIALTESGQAYCRANQIVAQDLAGAGLQMEKRWLDYEAGACDVCRINAEAGWIPLAQAFPSGDDRPLGHPSCRCDAAYRRVGSETEE